MSRNQRRAVKLALNQRLKNWVNPLGSGRWGRYQREFITIDNTFYLGLSFEECSDTALSEFKEIKMRR